MATTPAAFYGSAVTKGELSFLLKNDPSSFREFTVKNEGTAGPDAFTGTGANEIFVLGAGDTVKAGAGYDAVQTGQSFTIGSSGVEAVALTGSAKANVTGSSANNNIVGNAGSNTLKGGAGNDVLIGGKGADKLYGDAGKDTLVGGLGNDKLYGGTGNDSLFGSEGNDLLYGGSGRDTLVGGAGTDKLYGGAGKDEFVIGRKDKGVDVIADFKKDQDIIDLTETGTTSFSQLKLKEVSDGTIVTAKDGTKFKLVGYDPDEISGSFFDFK